MHNILKHIMLLAAVPAMLVACSAQEDSVDDTGKAREVALNIKASTMGNIELTRASQPLGPEIENMIKTLDIFQFDAEGNHDRNSGGYSHREFTSADNKDGVLETTITETLLSDMRTLCVVANVPKEQVDKFYADMAVESGQTEGRITLDQLRKWQVRFNYIQRNDTDAIDKAGWVRQMYMFGSYESDKNLPSGFNPSSLQIVLGRLAARLDITIVNRTGQVIDPDELLYHFDNVPRIAYLYPGDKGVKPDSVENGNNYMQNHTALAGDGDSFTNYFYMAGNSAEEEKDATKLHLFYKKGGFTNPGDIVNGGLQIPLCNFAPEDQSDEKPNYYLNRNTIYGITINITKAKSGSSRSIVTRSAQRPGQMVIDVPITALQE